jgi:uncharacterized DUF497 family protein
VIYEWDPRKARRNLQKHGVSFDEATSVFLDPIAFTFSDPDHSEAEDREITVGTSGKGRVIFVSHCEVAGRVRIISARKATRKERGQYEEAHSPRER